MRLVRLSLVSPPGAASHSCCTPQFTPYQPLYKQSTLMPPGAPATPHISCHNPNLNKAPSQTPHFITHQVYHRDMPAEATCWSAAALRAIEEDKGIELTPVQKARIMARQGVSCCPFLLRLVSAVLSGLSSFVLACFLLVWPVSCGYGLFGCLVKVPCDAKGGKGRSCCTGLCLRCSCLSMLICGDAHCNVSEWF